MTRILYLDASAGVSGDMFVGALVDLGASIEIVQSHVASLGLAGVDVRARKVKRSGLIGTKFDVLDPCTGNVVDAFSVVPEGEHDILNCGNVPVAKEPQLSHCLNPLPSVNHPHRGLQAIRRIIRGSMLPDPVAADALGVFELLGNAEAKVHGVHPGEIHFHEIGALDAIADIVSAASAFNQLEVDEAWCSMVHVGYGTVRCVHGTFPVPAPATLELLKGIPTYSNGVRGELVTPTGAALVRYFCRRFCPMKPMVVTAIGYGAGSKDYGIPNLLRAILGEVTIKDTFQQDEA